MGYHLFFDATSKKILTINRYIERRYSSLFKTNNRQKRVLTINKTKDFEKSRVDRIKSLHIMAEFNPLYMKEFKRMSIIDYYDYLYNLEAVKAKQKA